MTAGDLRDRVTFQTKGGSADGLNQPGDTWTDGDTVWAKYEPVSGQELSVGETVRSVVTGRVTIRAKTGITSKMRLKLNGWQMTDRILNIAAVLRPEPDGTQSLLVAEPEAGIASGGE